jgi:hypothetical protein
MGSMYSHPNIKQGGINTRKKQHGYARTYRETKEKYNEANERERRMNLKRREIK